MSLVAKYQVTSSLQYMIESTHGSPGEDGKSSLCFSACSTERNTSLSIVNCNLTVG